jgi:predicted nucleic acid-binding protein
VVNIKAVCPSLSARSVAVRRWSSSIKRNSPPAGRYVQCALAAKADFLISGNTKHFPFAEFKGTQIVTPAEFAAIFLEEIF